MNFIKHMQTETHKGLPSKIKKRILQNKQMWCGMILQKASTLLKLFMDLKAVAT